MDGVYIYIYIVSKENKRPRDYTIRWKNARRADCFLFQTWIWKKEGRIIKIFEEILIGEGIPMFLTVDEKLNIISYKI